MSTTPHLSNVPQIKVCSLTAIISHALASGGTLSQDKTSNTKHYSDAFRYVKILVPKSAKMVKVPEPML